MDDSFIPTYLAHVGNASQQTGNWDRAALFASLLPLLYDLVWERDLEAGRWVDCDPYNYFLDETSKLHVHKHYREILRLLFGGFQPRDFVNEYPEFLKWYDVPILKAVIFEFDPKMPPMPPLAVEMRRQDNRDDEIELPQIPKTERAYYRETWGFDPAVNLTPISQGWFRYEENFPLTNDPPVDAVNVIICAQVDWKGEEVRLNIVFMGKGQNAAVRCTHTKKEGFVFERSNRSEIRIKLYLRRVKRGRQFQLQTC